MDTRQGVLYNIERRTNAGREAVAMRSETYKGFEITVRSQWDQDTGKWTVEVIIMRETDGMATAMSKQFKSPDTHNGEDEAVAASHQYGKDVIDGNVAGASVSDL
jgi:hypothetical protein